VLGFVGVVEVGSGVPGAVPEQLGEVEELGVGEDDEE